MSTKSTLLYIEETDEHWYRECLDESIVLEFSRKSIERFESDEYGISITIKAKSPLMKALESIDKGGWPR